MLRPAKSRRLDVPIAVSLDDLVPSGHFYRPLDAILDLGFVRDRAGDCHADRGRPGIDPVGLFKFQLIMFFDGIRSERHLVGTAALNLAHRRYLGYALDEPLPDHTSLPRIRHQLGLALFERFFERVVDLCHTTGLVWGRELFIDATKVRADADLDSLIPRFAYDAKTLRAGLFDDEAPAPPDPTDPPGSSTCQAQMPAGCRSPSAQTDFLTALDVGDSVPRTSRKGLRKRFRHATRGHMIDSHR